VRPSRESAVSSVPRHLRLLRGAALVVVALAVLPASAAAEPSGEATFFPVEAVQSFTVPADVHFISISARGSSGAHIPGGGPPGYGALVSGTFEVTPGEQLQIYVSDNEAWGWAIGGNHGEADTAEDGGRGGGASAVLGSTPFLIAGGGGGGGGDSGRADGGRGGNAGAPEAAAGAPGNIANRSGEVPYPGDAGGCGGCEEGTHGGAGESDKHNPFGGGGGGGGGGGARGGNGGEDGDATVSTFIDFSGAGGGGGSSYIRSGGLDTEFSLATECATGPETECEGLVQLSWGGEPTEITAVTGAGQTVPALTQFRGLTARVTDTAGVPVTGVPVSFTVPASGASGDLPGETASGETTTVIVETNGQGLASLEGMVSNEVLGAWTLVASVPGVKSTARFALVNAAIASAVALTSSPNPSTTLETPELTAAVRGELSMFSPALVGLVEFEIDGVPMAPAVAIDPDAGAARLPADQVPALAVGPHTIEAHYLGDPLHAGSSSGAQIQTVLTEPTALAVEGVSNPAAVGSGVDLQVTVSARTTGPPPTGTVTFFDAGLELGSAAVGGGGSAVFHSGTPSAGIHEVTASYSGDGRYAAAVGSFVEVVDDGAVAAVLSSAANPSTFGAGSLVEAEIRRGEPGPTPAGTVDFSVDGDPVCGAVPTADARAGCRLPDELAAGTHEVRAQFTPAVGSGDSAATGTLQQAVVAAPTLTAIAATPRPTLLGAPFALAATVARADGGAATGTVDFRLDGTALGAPVALAAGAANLGDACATAGSEPVCPPDFGLHTVEARFQPGDPNLRPGRAVGFLQVEPDTTTTRVALSSPGIAAETPTFTATVGAASGTPRGAVQFLLDGTTLGEPVAVLRGSATAPAGRPLSPGPHQVVAHYLGTDRFAPSESNLGFRAKVVPPAPGPAPQLHLLSREARVRADGSLLVSIACSGAAGSACAEPVRLTLPADAKFERGTALPGGTLLADADATVAAGSTQRLRITLRPPGRRLISAHRTLATAVRFGDGRAEPLLHLRASRAARLLPLAAAVESGAALVRLRCAAPGDDPDRRCRGEIELRFRGHRAAVAQVSVAAAKPETVRLALPAWALAPHGGAVSLLVRVSSQIPVGLPTLAERRFQVRP
jgi:hypothetical protein